MPTRTRRSAAAPTVKPAAKRPPKERPTHPNASAFPAGLAGPALRALAGAGIRSVADLARWSREELAELHGMGPKALQLLESARARGATKQR